MSGFDFSPGAQVPLTGAGGETAVTQALSTAPYRDGPVGALVDANPEAGVAPARLSLFEPNFGEAFAQAVQLRMLGGGRKESVQSFGMEPHAVVEHCLAATRIRKQRDIRLTVVMTVCGLLFLPGVLVWLGAFQLRRTLGKSQGRAGMLSQLVFVGVAVLAVILLLQPPLTGIGGLYLRIVLLVPIIGWYVAKRICERTAVDLRERWSGLLSGPGVGPKIPGAVPHNPHDARAEALRKSLLELAAEQSSNIVFYAGPKGILGMGSRWGIWQMAEELVPREGPDFHPFRSWDVIRAIEGALRDLQRKPIHTGGFTQPSVRHWIVAPIGEGAKGISRPSGPDIEAFTVKDFEVQRICNEQQFGSGNRHYLGVQFPLWDGQLVITMMITVTVLHRTLRVEVTGYALGPINSMFLGKPSPKSRTVAKSVKFWETRTIKLPLVDAGEVVRLAARAPLTWFPPILDFFGGHLNLPEPFGMRHSWADKPWKHRFMADDALRAATPVLRAVHAATIAMLNDHGVNTERFASRSLALSGQVQDASPQQADAYNA